MIGMHPINCSNYCMSATLGAAAATRPRFLPTTPVSIVSMAGLQAVLGGGRSSVVAGLTATGLVAPCLLQLARSYGHLLGTPGGPDPHVWLEEVLGEKCLDWVKKTNASSISESLRRAAATAGLSCARALGLFAGRGL
jgi:hypothetical protein